MASRAAIRRVTALSPLASTGARARPTMVNTLISSSGGPTFQQPPGIAGPIRPSGNNVGSLGLNDATQAVISGGLLLCQQLGIPPSLCEAGAAVAENLTGGGGGGGGAGGGGVSLPGSNLIAPDPCTNGTVLNRDNGVCEFPGSPGDISTPGGPSGPATMGIFGAPALAPIVVGQVARRDGRVSPILRCNPGLVLGKDNLCYAKGSIPNKLRKWPKSARPPVSAYDARQMRKYGPGGSKQSSIKKLAGDAGLTCKRK